MKKIYKLINSFTSALKIYHMGLIGLEISFRNCQRYGMSRYAWDNAITVLKKLNLIYTENNKIKIKKVKWANELSRV